MRRREFISGLAVASLAIGSAITHAQQSSRLRTVGWLGPVAPAPQWVPAFRNRMRELGWIEGTNLAIEFRWAEGRSDRLPELLAELVRLNVDVIVTSGTPAVLAAKRATTTIPILFATAGDPVATGLVASLARPGGNVTGLSAMISDLAGKKLELLREVIPSLRRLAVLANAGFAEAMREMSEVEAVGKALGLEVAARQVRMGDEIVPSIASLRGAANALYVCGDPLFFGQRVQINRAAIEALLPTMHSLRDQVEAGGLISYGTNFPELFRATADYVDKILRGANPADIPVEQPTKFDLVFNLATARALGLTFPPALLARADEVIE